MSRNYPQSVLETDPYYQNPSYYREANTSWLPTLQTRETPSFLQFSVDERNALSREQLANILPSGDELQRFHEHRNLQLATAQNQGRQQRLAWIHADDVNKTRTTEDKENIRVVPTDDQLKVKLLHADPTQPEADIVIETEQTFVHLFHRKSSWLPIFDQL